MIETRNAVIARASITNEDHGRLEFEVEKLLGPVSYPTLVQAVTDFVRAAVEAERAEVERLRAALRNLTHERFDAAYQRGEQWALDAHAKARAAIEEGLDCVRLVRHASTNWPGEMSEQERAARDKYGQTDVVPMLLYFTRDGYVFDQSNDTVVVTRGLLRMAAAEIENLRGTQENA